MYYFKLLSLTVIIPRSTDCTYNSCVRLWLAWMCYCLGDTYRTGGVLLTNFSEIVHISPEDKTKA